MTKYTMMLIGFLILSFMVFVPSIYAEGIQDYVVKIDISENGEIQISEKIQYDFEDAQRHGIFRRIPFVKRNAEGKAFKMKISNIAVRDSFGNEYPFSQVMQNGELSLKIGDPHKKVTGMHTYVISYTVGGVITYFIEHDELYWNAIGGEWDVGIRTGKVEINLPQNTDNGKVINYQCFTGLLGEHDADCKGTIGDTGTIIFEGDNIGAGRGLTILVGFEKGVVDVLEPVPVVSFLDTMLGKAVALVVVITLLWWYLLYPMRIAWKWYKYGRDPDVGPATTAHYDPPVTRSGRELTPAETGTLVDETVHLRDVLSIFVDLSRRGYMKIIEEKNNTYSFFVTSPQKSRENESLTLFEQKLYNFIKKEAKGGKIAVKNLKLYKVVADIESDIYERLVDENFFPKNPKSTRTFYTVMGALALFTINIPLTLSAFIFGRAMPVKTEQGAIEANKAKALKSFLSSQKPHFDFVSGWKAEKQLSKQFIFERFFPYAVAFGVEHSWAEKFRDVALAQPEWYVSSTGGAFNSVVFADSLRSSYSSIASSASSTRSSSGFSSGFSSGGGFSGGGGGGGGGGSW